MNNFPNRLETTTTVIPNGAAISATVDLYGTSLVGIDMPAAFTGASLSFLVSVDNGATFQPLYTSAGALYSVPVVQGHYVAIPPFDFCGIRFLQIVSASNEGAARTLTLVARPIG